MIVNQVWTQAKYTKHHNDYAMLQHTSVTAQLPSSRGSELSTSSGPRADVVRS